jgi:TRAP-type C4-dicarboxylate transport system permease small subunit
MTRFAHRLSNMLTHAERVLHIMALVMLFGMMLLGFADVLLRYLFNSPISGAKETQTVMVPLIVAFAFAITQHNRANTRVELFYEKFPPRMKRVADFFALIPPLAIWALIAWQSIVTGSHYFETGRVVNMINLNLGYIQYAVAAGAAFLCLEMVRQLAQLITRRGRYATDQGGAGPKQTPEGTDAA